MAHRTCSALPSGVLALLNTSRRTDTGCCRRKSAPEHTRLFPCDRRVRRTYGCAAMAHRVLASVKRKGKPARPRLGNTGVSILCIEGGEQIEIPSPEADTLAKVWKACSQASGHPTRDTNHVPLTNTVIEEVLRIIVGHLKQSIYLADPDKLVGSVFTINQAT